MRQDVHLYIFMFGIPYGSLIRRHYSVIIFVLILSFLLFLALGS